MTPPRRSLVLALSFALVSLGCHEVHFESRETGEIDLYDHLYAAALPDGQNALAVGYRAAIYASGDGGDNWHERSIDWGDKPPAHLPLLYDVSMADDQRGWIVGQLGTILRTEDGGQTWTPQTNDKQEQGVHLFSLNTIDANTAWAVGVWGTRIYTDDGGRSWQDRSLTVTTEHPQYVWLTAPEQERVRNGEMVFEDVGLNDIYCRPAPSQRCWIVGEFGYIYWSDNRGKNWTPAEIVGTEKISPITFSFDDSEISDEDGERVKAFVEAILTQEHLNVLIEAYGSSRELAQFGGEDDPSGLFDLLDSRAVGVRAIIEETGILSDRMRMRGTPPWDYEDYLADDPGFLKRYLDGRQEDQGKVTVDIAQNPYLFRVRFADDMNGIITGLGGVVLTSDDGGLTWRYGDSGVKQALYALAPHDQRALAVGEKGLARESSDYGRTWGPLENVVIPEVFTFMRDVAFDPSGRVGMIVGQRGLVMRSTDGGAHWEKILPKPKVAAASTGH